MNKYFFTVISLIVLFYIFIWMAGSLLSSPANSQVGSPPASIVGVESVASEYLHGWFILAEEQKACVLLMHGVRSNRREMLSRAEFLREEGYSSFAIDLQAHGETPGEEITFGYLESESARKAVKFLYAKKSCRKVVALGNSLGGAASLLGKEPLNVDGFILESVYPRIEDAVKNRLQFRIGTFASVLAPFFYMQIPIRLGVGLESLRPLDAIRNIKSPVLVMNGTEDKRTTLEEARLLFNNAPEPKEFYQVEGASHTNLYEYERKNYKKVVLDFLAKYIDG